ncbi:MAG: hypothetical protein V1690_04030 [Candidatus Moraniibacteriota bacterium]
MKLSLVVMIVVLITQFDYARAGQECSPNIPNPPLAGQIRIAEISLESVGDNNGWVGLVNVSAACLDLSGWVLYDGDLSHELFITRGNTEGFSDGLLLALGSEAKVFQRGDQDFTLSNQGGRAELYSGPAEMLGMLQDSVSYPEVAAGESYRIIPKNPASPAGGQYPIPNEIPNSDGQEHTYRIPEDKSVQSSVISNQNNSKAKENNKKPSRDANSRGIEAIWSDNTPSSIQTVEPNNETIQQYDNDNNNLSPIIASSELEKSPWRWFYFLWGSWFLRHIILPFLGLWMVLYLIVYLLRIKLKKGEQ